VWTGGKVEFALLEKTVWVKSKAEGGEDKFGKSEWKVGNELKGNLSGIKGKGKKKHFKEQEIFGGDGFLDLHSHRGDCKRSYLIAHLLKVAHLTVGPRLRMQIMSA